MCPVIDNHVLQTVAYSYAVMHSGVRLFVATKLVKLHPGNLITAWSHCTIQKMYCVEQVLMGC